MPFWLKSKSLTWANTERERASSRHISNPQVYAKRRPGRGGTITIVLPGSLTETSFVEPLVVYHIKGITDCISEEVLGIDRKLSEATRSIWCGESSSRPRQTQLGQRSWQIATTVERLRAKVVPGRLSSAQYTMAESGDLHPTAGRRRREKGPPSVPSTALAPLPRLERASDTANEHSEDSAGEKEAKRQRSEPTTPVSTSSRHP